MNTEIQDKDVGHIIRLGLDREHLWEFLVECPGVGIAILNPEGVFEFANEEFRRIFLGASNVQLNRRAISEVFPRDWAQERHNFIARAREERRSMVVREIWRGRQIVTALKLIMDESGGVPYVMVVSRPVSRDELPNLTCELTYSEFVELGSLDVLTSRELTVLALVGQGFTLKQIAERLQRSFKTIDNHRASIGKKLRQTDRVALSIIAGCAGLIPGDEDRTRVRVPKNN